jgi:ring-1,2-phenylacetyl-CoA epoxidase subunit PaaA
VPKLWDLGITVPDDALAYDTDAGEWRWTEPDWDEFWRVVKGDGPMTETRLAWRRWMHEAHDWVRETLRESPEAA